MSDIDKAAALLASMFAGGIALVAVIIVLGGCATDTQVPVPSAKLELPSARLMADPPAVAAPKAGDDLLATNADLRAAYGRERGLRKSLQTYIRRITKGHTP